MTSLFRRLPLISRAWRPLSINDAAFARVPIDQAVEEELVPGYVASRYYPTRIGETLRDRYQIVGKLGFGATSTVWLARDLRCCQHVTLKLFINEASLGKQLDQEISIYRRITESSVNHPGRGAVRSLLDSFDVSGPDGTHRCLVHPPLGESIMTFLHRNPEARLPAPVLAFVLRRLFQALDFLHTECRVIHTDIKGDNIMFAIPDGTIFTKFEEQEMTEPSPRKVIDDNRSIHLSRGLPMTKGFGAPVLCDFGSAVTGGIEHVEDIQPDIYRAPEVVLEAPWSYEVDVWNAGCMIWDLFEGGHLFTGIDPEHQRYRSRVHLAEMVALLGDPPRALLGMGKSSHKFFTDQGILHEDMARPKKASLESRETSLDGESRDKFLAMMGKMLQWNPSKRATAKELAEDDWIMQYM